MQGYMPAARRLAQLPEKPQHLADGGAVGFGARGLAGLRQMIPLVQAMGYPQQQAAAPAPAPAPAPSTDPRTAQLQAMIPRMEAMGYKQQPQYLAKGGMVRGPGTGTSDSIPDEVEPGTYIMPADSTQAIGPSALEKMGKVPVRLSKGEYKLPPEQVMAIGEAVLKFMKDATHTPVHGVDGGQTDAEVAEARGFEPGAAERMAEMPEQLYADGGVVDPPRRPNSFGDAAAVASDPGVTQVRTSASDTFGTTAPAPAPAPAQPALGSNLAAATRMTSFSDPRSTAYDPNPFATANAQKLAAVGQSSRSIVEAGMPPAPAPATARNSFGDAAAATQDASVTQVASGAQPGRGTVSTVPAQPLSARATTPAAAPQPAAGFQTAAQRLAAPAPAAPMGWQARQGQRSQEVSAASITNRPEWDRSAGFQPRRYADGGMVEDDLQKRLAQIPTGGIQAPPPDASRGDPLNSEIGRNVMNTLSALPGVGGLASRGGAQAARAATGGALSSERVIPAAWEVVQDGGALVSRAAPAAQQAPQIGATGGGALSRAASMSQGVSQAALPSPGGALVQRAAGQVGEAAAGFAPRARAATQWADVVEPAALSAPAGQGAAAAMQAAPGGARGFGRYAAGAAGLGGAALLAGSGGDSAATSVDQGAAPLGSIASPAGAPALTASTPVAGAPPGAATALSALAQMPAGGQQNAVTRIGNSYTGPANISGDVTINGAPPRNNGQISAQNMAAADALGARQAQESAARVMAQIPAGIQLGVQAPTVRHSGNDWQARNDLRNLEVSAKSITADGGRFDRNKGESPEALAYRAALGTDAALRGSAPALAQQAMKEQGDLQRTALLNEGAQERTAMQEQGLNMRAVIEARRSGQAPAGYQWTSSGGLTHIPGGPADPTVRGNKAPLNDVQSKALQFGTRMQAAGSVLDVLAARGVDQPGLIKRAADAVGLGGAANWTQSGEQQQVEQAQRDFINAVLRRESGAAIADSEFANARQQYFPQVGDSPEVIAQKRKNREIATAGVLAEVPDSEKRVSQVLNSANSSGAPSPEAAAPAGAPVQVTDAASYQALPSGATYITPSGEVRRKK